MHGASGWLPSSSWPSCLRDRTCCCILSMFIQCFMSICHAIISHAQASKHAHKLHTHKEDHCVASCGYRLAYMYTHTWVCCICGYIPTITTLDVFHVQKIGCDCVWKCVYVHTHVSQRVYMFTRMFHSTSVQVCKCSHTHTCFTAHASHFVCETMDLFTRVYMHIFYSLCAMRTHGELSVYMCMCKVCVCMCMCLCLTYVCVSDMFVFRMCLCEVCITCVCAKWTQACEKCLTYA